jgi:hypothetical protein
LFFFHFISFIHKNREKEKKMNIDSKHSQKKSKKNTDLFVAFKRMNFPSARFTEFSFTGFLTDAGVKFPMEHSIRIRDDREIVQRVLRDFKCPPHSTHVVVLDVEFHDRARFMESVIISGQHYESIQCALGQCNRLSRCMCHLKTVKNIADRLIFVLRVGKEDCIVRGHMTAKVFSHMREAPFDRKEGQTNDTEQEMVQLKKITQQNPDQRNDALFQLLMSGFSRVLPNSISHLPDAVDSSKDSKTDADRVLVSHNEKRYEPLGKLIDLTRCTRDVHFTSTDNGDVDMTVE